MSLIEVLPNTFPTRTTHGWAYVPDIRPSHLPLEARKRHKPTPATNPLSLSSIHNPSSKAAKILSARLADLERENFKEPPHPLPIPTKTQSSQRPGGKKTLTPNVRRILTYQRTFAHYLADEEAGIAQSGSHLPLLTPVGVPDGKAVGGPGRRTSSHGGGGSIGTGKRKGSEMQPPPIPAMLKGRGRGGRKTSSSVIKIEDEPEEPATSRPGSAGTGETSTETPRTLAGDGAMAIDLTNETKDTTDPSLIPPEPLVLSPPSQEDLASLLSEPPLSYTAARARPLPLSLSPNHTTPANIPSLRPKTPTTKPQPPSLSSPHEAISIQQPLPLPQRQFCSTCGYWAKIRCKRCGERGCGLMECYKSHEGACAVPAY